MPHEDLLAPCQQPSAGYHSYLDIIEVAWTLITCVASNRTPPSDCELDAICWL